jgi:hypothetical protein
MRRDLTTAHLLGPHTDDANYDRSAKRKAGRAEEAHGTDGPQLYDHSRRLSWGSQIVDGW